MILNGNYGHGGDIYKNMVRLDFSANVNPLGTPEAVQRAVAAAAAELYAYPDPYCGALRRKLAAHLEIDEGAIVCGNGAAELISQFTAALRAERALLPVPSFSEYEAALRAAGTGVEYYALKREENFRVTEDILDVIRPGMQLLMLCSPNNPTGLSVSKALMLRILARCRETGTWFFVDECFYDLTDVGSAYTLVPELRADDRVFILRAFTKMYGMAGARLGYAVCRNQAMLEKMCALVQPWNVSSLAQAAGTAALDCTEFVDKTKKLIFREKHDLFAQLTALGLRVIPGEANFLMFSAAPELYDALLGRGILIRRCDNYRALRAGDYRIAVKTHEENEQLLAALREICHA